MNYPAASSGVSEDRNGMIMSPHPTLSREGRGNGVTLQQAAGYHPDSTCAECRSLSHLDPFVEVFDNGIDKELDDPSLAHSDLRGNTHAGTHHHLSAFNR